MTVTSSPAGPSRHRRKQTAENWDDDFEFIMPSRAKPSTSADSSKHLDQDSGESKANRGGRYPSSSGMDAIGKGREVEEEENWDTGGRWDEPPLEPVYPDRTSIQVRRGSKGPAPLIISSSQPSTRHLGLPRSSPSSSSPLPSPPSQASSTTSPQNWSFLGQQQRRTSTARDETLTRPKSMQRQSSSKSFTPLPNAPTVAISNDSSSSLILWTKFNRSSPNLPPASLPDPSAASSSSSSHARRPDEERELRHMKSGDMMPPPPVPGSSLLRRKSKKDKDRIKDQDVRESQVPFSPSMEQLRDMEGKKGFWKRFSGNAGGIGKGSPTSTHSGQELRRSRSSSVGSPTKIRLNLSPSDQPPLPPVPNTIRSPSAASSTSAISSASQTGFKSTGITGILKRSTSSLIRRSPSTKKDGSGRGTPPSAYAPPSPVIPRVPTRTSSRSSQLSMEGDAALHSDTRQGRERRNPSISRGYHLPSPAPGSPYHSANGYFDTRDVPPLPHSASFTSQMSGRSQREYSGSITGTDTEFETDETQITPKKKKKAGSGVISIGKSRGGSTGWTGDGWTGFPNSGSSSSDMITAPPLPTRTSSRSNLRLPSSQSIHLPIPNDTPENPPRSFSTLRRLSSLSKKHGRRLSGGFKFGTSGSSSSAEERKEEGRRRGKLETVVGSPIKVGRQAGQVGYGDTEGQPLERDLDLDNCAGDTEAPQSIKPKTEDRYTRAGSVSAPTSVLKPTQRDLDQEWTKLSDSNTSGTGLPKSTRMPMLEGNKVSSSAKEAKERRRQSWNDFVIPRNVLDKQRELKKGIEGVKRFAGGVETLKSLLAAHADLSSRLATSSDPDDLVRFDSLDREFSQWWEMATVLIEVGSTGQTAGQEQSVSFLPQVESPKRSRRITLASDEAKLASDLMRRTQSTSLHPPISSSAIISIGKKEPRKSSLPDPQDTVHMSGLLGAGGPPRASPDLWRASTGRQDLSKRQLEVLRTMLRTPVSDPSVPQRNDPLRGMSTVSASSTSASIVTKRQEGPIANRHAFRPSISRASTTDSRTSDRSLVHFDSPQQSRTTGTPAPKGPETFPSPNDSAYIVPSQSFPSPITASTLAYGRPGSGLDPSKMRRGSKVGLAGLREFLRGLKGKDSKKDLRGIRANQAMTTGSPTPGLPRYNPSREGLPLPLSPTSPSAKYPFAWRHKPTPSYTDLDHPLTPPAQPESRRPSDTPSFTGPLTAVTPSKPTIAGPPVSGKERRRPGLRGIFRAGSGSWSDLVTSSGVDKRGNKDIPDPQNPRVRSGGSTESAPPGPRPSTLRSTPSIDQLGGKEIRSTSGPSRLSVAEEGEMTVRPRKSRIMGLGWPEEAAAVREMDRIGSNVSTNTEMSSLGEDVPGEEDEQMEPPIALTPESLPVLLEYLRQCEAKLGEWRERVKGLS